MTTHDYRPDPLASATVGDFLEPDVIRPSGSSAYSPGRCGHQPVSADGYYSCTRDSHPAHHRHVATYTGATRDEVCGVGDLADVPDPLATVVPRDNVPALADVPPEQRCGAMLSTSGGYVCTREKHPDHWQHIATGGEYVYAVEGGARVPDVAPVIPSDAPLPVFPAIGSRARLREEGYGPYRAIGVIFSGAGDGRVRVAWADGPDRSTEEDISALSPVDTTDGGTQGRQARAFAHLAAQITTDGDERTRALTAQVTRLQSEVATLRSDHAQTLENIREKVIEKYREGGSICEPGLRRFLSDFDMDPIDQDYRVMYTVTVRVTASDSDAATEAAQEEIDRMERAAYASVSSTLDDWEVDD